MILRLRRKNTITDWINMLECKVLEDPEKAGDTGWGVLLSMTTQQAALRGTDEELHRCYALIQFGRPAWSTP